MLKKDLNQIYVINVRRKIRNKFQMSKKKCIKCGREDESLGWCPKCQRCWNCMKGKCVEYKKGTPLSGIKN